MMESLPRTLRIPRPETRPVPDNSVRIAQIREILAEGASTVVRDGTTVTWDLDQLRRELRELEATDDTHRGKRPVASQINLGNW